MQASAKQGRAKRGPGAGRARAGLVDGWAGLWPETGGLVGWAWLGPKPELHRRAPRAIHPFGAQAQHGGAVNGLLLAILGYVLAQFAIGAVVSRRMASEADYILAGRRLGVGLIAFSVFATYFGAEAIVASGGAVYERGLTGALVDPLGYAGAVVL